LLYTEPTESGQKELDVFHPSYRVKRIKAKKLDSFDGDLFLDVMHHAEKGVIVATMVLPDSAKD